MSAWGVVAVKWTWNWTLPFNTEFGDNPVFDWVRVVAVVLAVMLLCATGRVIAESRRRRVAMPPTQVARFVGLALACLSLAGTEIAAVGSVATPRLIVTLLAIGISVYGVRGMRCKQRADRPIR